MKHTMNDQHIETPQAYRAPAIEQVLTTEELERQVHYAGEPSVTF